MSKVARSEKQKERNARFAKAVAYAKQVMADPAKKQEFAQRTPKGKSVFRQALKEFLAA
ncbi:hypothetical protein [Pelobium manganitolerans]|uniref:hypothetical protein n=1 Tax=Pelobium manganitolerans TaxID=1842495 RepID=UPI003FA3A277